MLGLPGGDAVASSKARMSDRQKAAARGAASVAASRHSEPRHQTRTPHRPQPVVIALSRSTKTPSRTPSDSLAGMLTVAVPMGARS